MAELTHVVTKRNTIRDLSARHPMAAFIVLAYAFSCAWLLDRIDLGTVNGFGIIGSASPALAAMIVSAILRPEPSGVPAGKRWRSFGITGILALAVMAVMRLWFAAGLVTVAGIDATAVYPNPTAFLADVLAAVVVAFILSGVHSPRQGVRDLLRTLDPRRHPVRWYWWAIAVGLYPAIVALGNAICAGLGLPRPAPIASGPWYGLALNGLILSVYYLFGGGGLEEPGWRGFALPTLQKRYSPLVSSLIVAVMWAFWHWHYFWFGELPGGPLGMVFYLLLEIAPFAILFTAVFNRTGGSLPIAIVLHAAINITPIFLPPASSLEFSIATGLLIFIAAVCMWRSP